MLLAVVALMVAIMVMGGSASAQQGPPEQTRGCSGFSEHAFLPISENPAYSAFVKHYDADADNGIGPCHAPQSGGR